MAQLDTIDDELISIGVHFVTIEDVQVARDHGAEGPFPVLGLFRNGHFIIYEDDVSNEKQILKWMTHEETLKIIGIIDEVNTAMLDNIVQEETDAFVFFYDANDPEAHTILEELEEIDEKLDQQDLTMVKISDEGAKESYGIENEGNFLVYFENGVPELCDVDLFNDNLVMKWMKSELKQEEIKEVTVPVLHKLVEKSKTMAVLFYDPDADEAEVKIMDRLEKIDDDCARFGINFVKVNDLDVARDYGVKSIPGLLFFKHKIPAIYDGELEDEDKLLEWLVEQKTTG